jgi:hypothetical protein
MGMADTVSEVRRGREIPVGTPEEPTRPHSHATCQ